MRSRAPLALLVVPAAVLAAGGLEQTFGAMSVWEWCGTLGVSLLTGTITLLLRIRASQEARLRRNEGLAFEDGDIIRAGLWLYASSHVGGSVLAGFFTLFTTHDLGLSGHATAAAILCASFVGAKVVQHAAENSWLRSAGGAKGRA
jgi:hypothetical protein